MYSERSRSPLSGLGPEAAVARIPKPGAEVERGERGLPIVGLPTSGDPPNMRMGDPNWNDMRRVVDGITILIDGVVAGLGSDGELAPEKEDGVSMAESLLAKIQTRATVKIRQKTKSPEHNFARKAND